MKTITIVFVLLLTAGCILAQEADSNIKVSVDASLTTKTGEPRVFTTPNGTVMWTPSLPVRQGDRLTVTFLPSNNRELSRISVRLDNKPLADIKKPPWRVIVDTSGLSPGRHVVKGDVRFAGTPIMYSIAEYVFYVQDAPTAVKGTVEELGPAGRSGTTDSSDQPGKMFTPPPAAYVNKSIKVSLNSLDPQVNKDLESGQPIRINKPVTFRLDAGQGVDRWAYSLTRDGRQIAGAGPVARMVYLEVAPKKINSNGILPGEVILRAWGVRNDGAYSVPIEVPLVIE